MLMNLIIAFAFFCGLLFLLKSIFKDFVIEPAAIPIVALVLLGVDYTVGSLLSFILSPLKILSWLTLGLLGLFINWLINVVVFKVTDKLTESLNIASMGTLFASAAFLQVANWLLHFIRR